LVWIKLHTHHWMIVCLLWIFLITRVAHTLGLLFSTVKIPA
jgi:hypothetical protein